MLFFIRKILGDDVSNFEFRKSSFYIKSLILRSILGVFISAGRKLFDVLLKLYLFPFKLIFGVLTYLSNFDSKALT